MTADYGRRVVGIFWRLEDNDGEDFGWWHDHRMKMEVDIVGNENG